MGLPAASRLMELAAACAVLAAALSVTVALEGVPLPGDLRVTRELQAWPQLRENAALINGAAPWRWAVLAAAAAITGLGWRLGGGGRATPRERAVVFWALAAVLLLSLLSEPLKQAVRSPRPLESFGVRVLEQKASYGFPSGHVYGDMLVYGALAALAPAWVHARAVLPVRALLVAVIALAGPARVVVGAHWPSDTLGGYLWGCAGLALALAFAQWATTRSRPVRSRRSRGGSPSR